MEALQQARELYKDLHLQANLSILTDTEIYNLKNKIKRLVRIAIKEVALPSMFQSTDFLIIFEKALKVNSSAGTDLSALAKAYEGLEKYFLQLIEQPWKREFKRIKIYGGFYRTNIKSVIPEPEMIFQQAGYVCIRGRQLLVLDTPPQPTKVLILAFDSMLCMEQCQAIMDHYQVVKNLSVSWDDAVLEYLHSDKSRKGILTKTETTAYLVEAQSAPLQHLHNVGQGQYYGGGNLHGNLSVSMSQRPEGNNKENYIHVSPLSSSALPPTPTDNLYLSAGVPSSASGYGANHGPPLNPSASFNYGNNYAGFASNPRYALQNTKSSVQPVRNITAHVHKEERPSVEQFYEGQVIDKGLMRMGQAPRYPPGQEASLEVVNSGYNPNIVPPLPLSTAYRNDGVSNEFDKFYQDTRIHAKNLQENYNSQAAYGMRQNVPKAFPPGQAYYPVPVGGGDTPNVMITKNEESFYDEGIEKDLSPLPKGPHDGSLRFPSYQTGKVVAQHVQGVAVPKATSSSAQSSIADHGYGTALGFNGHSYPNTLAGYTQNPQQILRTNVSGLYTDGVMPSAPMGPPPIPPRALKPNGSLRSRSGDSGVSGSDPGQYPQPCTVRPVTYANATAPSSMRSVQGHYSSADIPSNSSLRLAAGVAHTAPSSSNPQSNTFTPTPANIPESSTGPALRRQRMHVDGTGKSSSLKYSTASPYGSAASTDKPSSVPYHTRGVQSMDLSRLEKLEWKCNRCTALNTALEKVCAVCAASRQSMFPFDTSDGGKSTPVQCDATVAGTSKKACPKCTFENDAKRNYCAMCDAELGEQFTHV